MERYKYTVLHDIEFSINSLLVFSEINLKINMNIYTECLRTNCQTETGMIVTIVNKIRKNIYPIKFENYELS